MEARSGRICRGAAAFAALIVMTDSGCHFALMPAMATYNAATAKDPVFWDVKAASVETGCRIRGQHGEKPLVIELHDVICPGEQEPFFREGLEMAGRLAEGETLRVEPFGDPVSGVQKGRVFLPDGRRLSHVLAAEGYVWWMPRTPAEDPDLEKLAKEARMAHRGVWKDPNARPPWTR